MTDQIIETTETAATALRIFRVGGRTIHEDESTQGLDAEAVRAILKRSYPEGANATLRETTGDDGQPVIEFLPKPGRKG